jgi:predicted phosphoadenosine phosphosulfate sulfurtransferase
MLRDSPWGVMPFIDFEIWQHMKYEIKPSNEIETRNYLEVFLYRVPQKNHEAVLQNLKRFVPFFKKHAVGIEYYLVANNGTKGVTDSAKEPDMEGMKSIAKTLSAAEDEEDICMELQYFRDHNRYQDIYTTMMMQDKNPKILGDELFSLVTHGKGLVTGAFSHLTQ